MPSPAPTTCPRAAIRGGLVAAALALAACTAPPPGHPYVPLAPGNEWAYEGHQRAPDRQPTYRADRHTVKSIAFVDGAVHAAIDAWRLGEAGAQGTNEETWTVTPAGLLPSGAIGEASGVALPQALERAAPWTLRERVGDGIWAGRSRVAGRRRLTVAAGAFDTLVVETIYERDAEGRTYVELADYACGLGLVRRVMQDGDGHGFVIELSASHVIAPERGCDREGFAALPLHGADEIAAAAERRCDVARLETIGRELGDDPPADRRRAALSGLVDACAGAVPPSIAAYLETGVERLPYEREPEVEHMLDETCPLRHVLKTWGQTSLTPEHFDACDLARVGVIDRAELDGADHPLLALALHRWFVAGGVSPSAARALARALLARERAASFITPGLTLPAADVPVHHPRMSPLEVTASGLRFAGVREPALDRPRRRADDDPLLLALATEVDRTLALAEAREEPQDVALLIAVDVAASFDDLLDGLYLARDAGVTQLHLAAERPDGRTGALLLAPSSSAHIWDSAADPAPALTVELAGPSITVRPIDLHGPEVDPRPIALAALRPYAEALKARDPSAHRLVISPAEHGATTTAAELFAVLLALRDALPDVVLTGAPAHHYVWLRPAAGPR